MQHEQHTKTPHGPQSEILTQPLDEKTQLSAKDDDTSIQSWLASLTDCVPVRCSLKLSWVTQTAKQSRMQTRCPSGRRNWKAGFKLLSSNRFALFFAVSCCTALLQHMQQHCYAVWLNSSRWRLAVCIECTFYRLVVSELKAYHNRACAAELWRDSGSSSGHFVWVFTVMCQTAHATEPCVLCSSLSALMAVSVFFAGRQSTANMFLCSWPLPKHPN